MKRFKTIAELVKALQEGEIPSDVVSPGAAAAALGVTRQAIHDRLKHSTLDAWYAEGVILISTASLKAAVKRKLNIPDNQGELDVSTQ